MTFELSIVAVLVVGIPLGIAISLRRIVRTMMSSPDAMEDSSVSEELIEDLLDEYKAFLHSVGFRYSKAYTFHGSKIGVWIQINPDPPLRFFILSKPRLGEWVHEFATDFSDETSLTTTTTRSAFIFPRPFGSFLQSFPSSSFESLWSLHLRGEEYVVSELSISVNESQLSFLESFKQGIVRELNYVVSLPLWWVRGVYWYAVK